MSWRGAAALPPQVANPTPGPVPRPYRRGWRAQGWGGRECHCLFSLFSRRPSTSLPHAAVHGGERGQRGAASAGDGGPLHSLGGRVRRCVPIFLAASSAAWRRRPERRRQLPERRSARRRRRRRARLPGGAGLRRESGRRFGDGDRRTEAASAIGILCIGLRA